MDKITFANRLINGVLGLVFCGFGLTALVMAAQRSSVRWNVNLTALDLAYIATGALLLGIVMTWLSATQFQFSNRRIPLGSSNVVVSQRSIDEILHYVTLDHASIRGCKSRVRLVNDSWEVQCDLWISPAASIPTLSRELEAEIRQTMLHHTGIPVGSVDFNIAITSKMLTV